ncbi:protein of unknown function [Chryseolinea serpens]|uniref:DUF4184 family protein n=1 Tax=Chryseolinea serpens TaxID=947013 RepID=A0A1M5VXL1_9BACT|nr:DUF4184 family protein [Chryseolinea serpens]SHH80022.1 protein of unknown function [Chryseolinea serpens]
MPFTPAHPALVLPLIRWRYVSATALIIGSMAPDFEYFFKMSVNGSYGHTLWGVFYFDLPITFLLAWLFHAVVKRNAIHNLPRFLQRKFQDTLALDFMTYLKSHAAIFIASALVGTASHLLWDNFTHNDGYFAGIIPAYKTVFFPYDGVKYPLFYALQNISSGVGLTIVLVYLLVKKPTDNTATTLYIPRIDYWALLAVITMAVVALRFWIKPSDYHLGNAVVSVVSGLLVALVLCGWINFKNTASS